MIILDLLNNLSFDDPPFGIFKHNQQQFTLYFIFSNYFFMTFSFEFLEQQGGAAPGLRPGLLGRFPAQKVRGVPPRGLRPDFSKGLF